MITIVITIKIWRRNRKYIPLMIKNNGHQNPLVTEGKIRIRQGFKSGNWENQGNSTVNL